MPIHLTWTAPVEQGAGIISYNLYKRTNTGPLNLGHLYQILPGNIFTYDDYVYNRRSLEYPGYIYKITATSQDGESDLSLSSTILVQYSFEDFVDLEPWDFVFTGEDILELLEEWNLSLPSTPFEEYVEEWEPLPVPIPPSTTIAWTELWEYTPTTDFEDWEYLDLFTPEIVHSEIWAYSLVFGEEEIFFEDWAYSLVYAEELSHFDDWDS